MRLCLVLLACLAASALCTPALAQRPAMPEQQQRFHLMLAELKQQSDSAANDAARVALRQERARRTQAEGLITARNWIGNITRIGVDERGHATVIVNLPGGVGLVLTDGRVNGERVGTPLPPGTDVFRQVSVLTQGQMVRFDARFVCTGRAPNFSDCPADVHVRPSGALTMPMMLATFTRIVPLEPVP